MRLTLGANIYRKGADMATKAQLLVFTKYYKGEDECPEHIRSMPYGRTLWQIEEDWVTETLNHTICSDVIPEYIAYTHGKMPTQTGLPISLLAYIFRRMGKCAYSISDLANEFPDFIKTHYWN